MLADNGRKIKQCFEYNISLAELRCLLRFVVQNHQMMYEIANLLQLFRLMRTSEMLAVNEVDFSEDYSRLTYREAKTNKFRIRQIIIPEVARRVKLYLKMNSHRLKDGYLFPYYHQKNGYPHMNCKTYDDMFNKIRHGIARTYPEFSASFLEKYPNGYYRIRPYSLRKFGESYLYTKNGYNLILVKQIMEYQKIDTLKHYIFYFEQQDQKDRTMLETFCPLSQTLITGQKRISDF